MVITVIRWPRIGCSRSLSLVWGPGSLWDSGPCAGSAPRGALLAGIYVHMWPYGKKAQSSGVAYLCEVGINGVKLYLQRYPVACKENKIKTAVLLQSLFAFNILARYVFVNYIFLSAVMKDRRQCFAVILRLAMVQNCFSCKCLSLSDKPVFQFFISTLFSFFIVHRHVWLFEITVFQKYLWNFLHVKSVSYSRPPIALMDFVIACIVLFTSQWTEIIYFKWSINPKLIFQL